MAEETSEVIAGEVPEETAEEPTKKGLGGKILLILAVLIGVGGGFGVGAPFVGPLVGARLAASGGGGHEEFDPESVFSLENLVVNPAGSGGASFLMTTIAIRAVDAEIGATFRAYEAELKSLLILTLGSKTVEQLTDIEQRYVIAAEIRAVVESVLGEEGIYAIYIPQYVLQ